MKTKVLLIVTLLNLGLFSVSATHAVQTSSNAIQSRLELDRLVYGDQLISVGHLNTSVTENIKLKPDTATFSITYLSQGSSPVDASNQNAEGMKTLNSYLAELGIKPDDLVTLGYRNYENTQQSVTNQQVRYETQLSVMLDIDQTRFFDVVNLLADYQISDLKRVESESYYTFTITQSAETAEQSKQGVNQTYQQIATKLKKLGLEDIILQNYTNNTLTTPTEPVKTYFVENTLQIKTHDFDLLGKIIAKAQSLKMTINNDIQYSVSAEAKNSTIAKHEATILAKLKEKAQRLLSDQNYQLGVANQLQLIDQSATVPFTQPRYNRYAKSPQFMLMAESDQSDQVNIQPPSEFEITLMLSGRFDILKPIGMTESAGNTEAETQDQ